MDKRGGEGRKGISQTSVKILLSHSAEKFRSGTLLCCVSETFRKRKKSYGEEGGSIKIFRRKVFV